ncbi:MAG: biopolymer transporter ExbD [Bacteroidetes bacterium]|nr:MAG: biopolymer transporter ExbD [Bacteroidota bacterium]REK00757.1 MAG: biopolymer transporter ExbD [Bacteroidota bacterium]REK35005.1 MAG: biopolymer transporter ExbD [Bacteroidota bacterium]REK48197.1 MAG: biopolymer transporter ExbD [Bacteroidota bacterium]
MAEVQQQEGQDKGKHKKVRAKKASTHIDMTPMVDLAFLLLTFFILTTTLAKPKTMDITMPVKDEIEDEQRTKVPASQTMSILLTENDRIIWYMGMDDPTQPPETNIADFSVTGANSIHKVLLERNKLVIDLVKMVEDSVAAGLIPNKEEEIKKHKAAVKAAEKRGLIVLIKPDDKSKYKNLVDILDEMIVTNVGRYAIVDLSDSERELIKNASAN